MLLCNAQAAKNFLVLVQTKVLGFSLLQFYDAVKTERLLSQADKALEIKQFYKYGRHNWHQCSHNLRAKLVQNKRGYKLAKN